MSFFYPDTIDFQCLAIFFYYGCRFETLIENHALSRLLFWIDHKPLTSFVFCGVHVIFTLYTTFKLFCSHGQIKRKMFLKILKGNLIAYLLQAWIAHIEWKKLMVWFYQKSYGFFYAHLIELSKIFDHQQILEFCLMVNYCLLLPISTI